MINNFLQSNQNQIITLAWDLDLFEGILTEQGRGWWIVAGHAFHINQVSSCGMQDKPYVVVG